ncbi:AraC family transcriptional regulator [Ornithinicoccus hortensis]|uniref:AraC family transcriptional regulator n=1 Tax=Ornithinicoccus hortensis TaxID=82346 RepID=A0A542YTR4_9MICO|nr:AraC family transcriptional regulator [Ornithinicoccus hortensis]
MLPTIGAVPLADSRQPGDAPRQPGDALRRAKGVLWPARGREVYESSRDWVEGPLSLVLSRTWWVRWRREESVPFRAEVLGDPIVHLTLEEVAGGESIHGVPTPAALVHGVVTKVFTVDLPRAGRVTGVGFHPGGLAALLDRDVADLTGRVVDATGIVGPAIADVARTATGLVDEADRQRILLDHLAELFEPVADRVAQDTTYRAVRRATDLMRSREQVSLGPIAEAVHLSPRTLQRAFTRYVGVSPLRVLRRFRLQDAAHAIDSGQAPDLATLATRLGWSDQAHFTREFTAVIGVSPARYRSGRVTP